jgi:hypothetical protein
VFRIANVVFVRMPSLESMFFISQTLLFKDAFSKINCLSYLKPCFLVDVVSESNVIFKEQHWSRAISADEYNSQIIVFSVTQKPIAFSLNNAFFASSCLFCIRKLVSIRHLGIHDLERIWAAQDEVSHCLERLDTDIRRHSHEIIFAPVRAERRSEMGYEIPDSPFWDNFNFNPSSPPDSDGMLDDLDLEGGVVLPVPDSDVDEWVSSALQYHGM